MTPEPIWLSVAATHIGIREIPGSLSAAVIQRWAADLGVSAIYDNDDVPWCALYLNRVMKACHLPMTGSGYDLLRARMFATWGQPLDGVALGAILVFTRPQGAHVGLYLGETDTLYHIRGGNQSNAVSDTWIAKDRCTARRWPAGLPLPIQQPIVTTTNGMPVSDNER